MLFVMCLIIQNLLAFYLPQLSGSKKILSFKLQIHDMMIWT